MDPLRTLLILSGGADSATLAYYLTSQGHDLSTLSFNYGQRHARELRSAAAIAAGLGIKHDVIDLPIGALLSGSALTDSAVPVPQGHYAEESMRQTVVPNRNTIMLSIAWGIACAQELDFLAFGAHAGDHYIYPDCRPEYVAQLEQALRAGTEGHRKANLALLTPFIDWKKAEIIKRGIQLGVPYHETWTCYEGGAVACGKCGSCRERIEAFELAGGADTIPYQAAA